MSLEKIKDRIKKLLAMADDTSSPNEAAIAAGRASKLMEKHNIEHKEVLLETLGLNEVIAHDVAGYANWPLAMQDLAIRTVDLYDAELRVEKGRLEFLGMREDCEVAESVFIYLLRQINHLSEMYRKEYRVRSKKRMRDFKDVAMHEIAERLRTLKKEKRSEGKELVLHKSALIREKFDVGYDKGKRRKVTADTVRGMRAGRGVNISAPSGMIE